MTKMLPPVTPLGQLRRDRHWSFQELQHEIEVATGHTFSRDTLRRACHGIGDTLEITQATIDKFLAIVASTQG